MKLSFSLNDLILFQIALFAIFSPFAVIGPYSVLTEGYSRKTRGRIAFRVSVYSSLVLILVAWGGEAVLRILGISIESLAAAGGLILIISSLPMIMKGEAPRRKVKPHRDTEDEDDDWETMVVSPLVFPLTIGAGSISLVITQVGLINSVADRLALTVCLVLHGVFIMSSYMLSVPLAGKLGGKGSVVITRVGGIILLSLAFKIFTNGLKVLLPGLAG